MPPYLLPEPASWQDQEHVLSVLPEVLDGNGLGGDERDRRERPSASWAGQGSSSLLVIVRVGVAGSRAHCATGGPALDASAARQVRAAMRKTSRVWMSARGRCSAGRRLRAGCSWVTARRRTALME